MMVSTRGRYALRVMIDLAEQDANSYIPLKDIVARQNISQKYIEAIMNLLSKQGLVSTMHGKGGGYKLSRKPSDYKIGEILRLTEVSIAPVACLNEGAPECDRATECRTLPLWAELNKRILGFLDSVTIADYMKKKN